MNATDIITVLSDMGIMVPETDDVNLQEYIDDSLQFISFIVEIEGRFNIEIPDDLLTIDAIDSLNGFVSMLDEIVSKDHSSQP